MVNGIDRDEDCLFATQCFLNNGLNAIGILLDKETIPIPVKGCICEQHVYIIRQDDARIRPIFALC